MKVKWILPLVLMLSACASHKQVTKKIQSEADTLVTELVSESSRKTEKVDFVRWLKEMDAVLTYGDSVVEYVDSTGSKHVHRKGKIELKKQASGNQSVIQEERDSVKETVKGSSSQKRLQKKEETKDKEPSTVSKDDVVSWKLTIVIALIAVWLLGLYKSSK